MEAHQQLGGRYVLLTPLGRGGMAVVWRARDEILGRTVAIKLLAGRHAGDPDSRRRIRDEARAAAALSHPNIAQVHDYGESSIDGTETPYVVMELVRGTTLQERMMSPMSPRFAMRVCAEVAAALAAAHADGLVHRDIKPANVLLADTGAKVVDFGIAAAISRSGTGDTDEEVYGTPAYLAPERLTDDAVDPASDVYALGVLLYRLLSGHSPWSADTTTQMLTAHIYVAPEPLPAMPGVPAYVTELCNRCLAKDVTMRPSAREVAALLAQAAGLRVVADEPGPAAAGGTAVDPTPSVLIRRDATTAPSLPPPGPAAAGPTPPGRGPAGLPATAGAATAGTATAAAPAGAAAAAAGAAGAGAAEHSDGTGRAAVPAASAAGAGPAQRVRARAAVLAVVVVALVALAWVVLPDRSRDDRAADALPATTTSAGAPPSRATATTSPRKPVAATATERTAGGAAPTPTSPTATATAAADATEGPGEPEPTATATTTATRPAETSEPEEPDREWSFSSEGGTVRAACPSPGRAELLSWTAKKPYKVDGVDAGPATAPAATFKHGNDRLRMTVTCSGGTASATTEEA